MQPEDKNNYWENETDETADDKITETYSPDQESDEPADNLVSLTEDDNLDGEQPVYWSAKEYVDNHKNGLWFVIFSFVVLGLIAVDIFFLMSYTFSALVAVMAIAIIVFSSRPAREIEYTLSGDQGIYVGEKLYHYSDFKSFGVIKDGDSYYIMLIPVKRFALGLSIYFPPEVGEDIVDILGARLPMQDLKLDMIDKIVRKLRI